MASQASEVKKTQKGMYYNILLEYYRMHDTEREREREREGLVEFLMCVRFGIE